LIINELAGGVGLNLQCCANALVLERQWNAADEEQFESRFHRDGQTYPVQATYMMATGTIDEWFDEMVEEKQKIFGATVSHNFVLTSDEGTLKTLALSTLEKPLR
jgi:SNF2 family DNA or RNA helicase